MNSKTFMAAGKRVEVASQRMTHLEAVHKSNMAKRVIQPNGFYNAVFLSKDGQGRFKQVPEEIMDARPLYSGTFGVIGAKGKNLGKRLETEVDYDDQRKTLIIETEGGPAEVMLCCDHGFSQDGVPHLQLFDAKTNQAITNQEGMLEADEVIMRFNGKTYTFSIQNRDGGVLETVEGVNTLSWVDDSAVGGLFWRGVNYYKCYGQYVGLNDRPSSRFGVVREASEAGAPLETADPKIQVIERDGELIIKGTPEQLAAAKEALTGLR